MNKKKVVAFTIATGKHVEYAELMAKTFKHFNPDIPLIVYGEEDMAKNPNPEKYYLATPYFAKELIKEYELVIKLDADQLFFHDINHIVEDTSYDVGTVLNWNPIHAAKFGEVGLATISPQEYMNCGFVSMRSEAFIKQWWDMCNSFHFPRMPFREQGFLNILYYYNQYKGKCFDYSDKWHGLISNSEWLNMIVKDDKVMLLANDAGYPTQDIIIVAVHWAEGSDNPNKMNWRVAFNQPVQDFIERILNEK